MNFNAIRKALASGKSQREVARQFGISQSYVCDIATGKAGYRMAKDSQVQKLRDRSADKQKALRDSMRAEYLFEEAVQVIQKLPPLIAPPVPSVGTGGVTESAVLHLSDGHHDQVVKGHEVGGLEEYNFNISCQRAANLVDATLRFTQNTLSNFNFKELVVFAHGDHTSGQIHGAEARSQFKSQFKNTLAISQLHALMLRDLSAYFPRIRVLYLSGNHGRVTDQKQYPGGGHNNWDYMVAKTAQALCRDIKNLEFNIPDSWSEIVDVCGYKFHVSHGDDIQGKMGQPWTGLRARHERLAPLHRDKIDYYCIGHHHTYGDVSGNGVSYLTNGAWLATDPYAYNSLGVAGEPTQLLHGVHKDHGVSWRLPLRLRDGKHSKRYSDAITH
jgi:hypothetical protein